MAGADRAFDQLTRQLGLEILLAAKPPLKFMMVVALKIQDFHAPIIDQMHRPVGAAPQAGFQGVGVSQVRGQVPDNTFCSHKTPTKVLASVMAPSRHACMSCAGVAVFTSKNSSSSRRRGP